MKILIIGFILGGIIFGSIGIYAASYLASDITYTKDGWEVSNVNEALDELYSKLGSLTLEPNIVYHTSVENPNVNYTITEDGDYMLYMIASATNVSSLTPSNNFNEIVSAKNIKYAFYFGSAYLNEGDVVTSSIRSNGTDASYIAIIKLEEN